MGQMFPQFAELWYRRPRLVYALTPLGLLYRGLSAVRRSLYRCGVLRSTRLPVPVVVVGNIAVGGTGKTPLTQWLVEGLQAKGLRPAVVSRSYAASADSPSRVAGDADPAVRGDEAVLLASRVACPVWSGPDRTATARALLAAHPDVNVLVCDDGLQHYALERDVEIAVIDSARGFGNGLSLPAGPLREPRTRLRSVDAIVVNGNDKIAGLPSAVPRFTMTLHGDRFRSLTDAARTASPTQFAGKRLAAVAGIGNPARFFAHLHSLGLVFSAHAFPDHHHYRTHDLRLAEAEIVLMTEKDAIKCAAMADARMWTLPVAAMLGEGLLERVLERLSPSPDAPRRTPVSIARAESH